MKLFDMITLNTDDVINSPESLEKKIKACAIYVHAIDKIWDNCNFENFTIQELDEAKALLKPQRDFLTECINLLLEIQIAAIIPKLAEKGVQDA